jgi:hypothetical protein
MIETVDRLTRGITFHNPSLCHQRLQGLDREMFSTFIQDTVSVIHQFSTPFLSVFRARMMNQVVENAAPELCIVLDSIRPDPRSPTPSRHSCGSEQEQCH